MAQTRAHRVLNVQKFAGKVPPQRHRFWDSVVNELGSLRKLAGKNCTISESTDGTVINFAPGSTRQGGGTGGGYGACCIGSDCHIDTAAGCAASGGLFAGVGTSCIPNPCGTLGACCVGTTCSITTPAACATKGGTFVGIGQSCTPNPCQPSACCKPGGVCAELTKHDCDIAGGAWLSGKACSPNPCVAPSINLVCDSISASLSKCGFSAYQSSGDGIAHKYLNYHIDYTCDYYEYTCNCKVGYPGYPGCIPNCSGTDTPCAVQKPRDNLNSCTCHYAFDDTYTVNPDGSCSLVNGSGSCPSTTGCQGCELGGSSTSLTPTSRTTTWTRTCTPGGQVGAGTTTRTETLSSEYTTSMLKTNTVNAFPGWPGTFTGSCSAAATLSSDQSSYTIQRFKYKFTFSASTTPFTIHWTVNRPSGAVMMSQAITVGSTESSVYEEDEPSTGTTTISSWYTTVP